MLSCQEMSHAPPMTLEMTAMTQDQMYQGMESGGFGNPGRRAGLHLRCYGNRICHTLPLFVVNDALYDVTPRTIVALDIGDDSFEICVFES